MNELVMSLIEAGFYALWEYLSAHVLLCLVPAFFISGAFCALISRDTIMKYLGGNGTRLRIAVAYLAAAVSGLILEVCSCTILPLFAGIWKKGAGFGPAITFLFAGPGVTLLSTPLTAAVIGPSFALIKLLLSIVIAIVIGLAMEIGFHEKREKQQPAVDSVLVTHEQETQRSPYQSGLFFLSLTLVMIFGTAPVDLILKGALVLVTSIITAVLGLTYYTRVEIKSWLRETYRFTKMIFPILLIGVFISGVIRPLIPQVLVVDYTGTNTVLANFIAVMFGTIAYFPTLVEVPIAEMFMELGMHHGPLMAYLIADPAVSIQTLLVVNKIMKPARTIAYAVLLILFSIAAGLAYGFAVL
ncbi:permease [Candidatus Thorarchaeota archaeon]|nr:MAG: permease [Candidatus Thorarchaeota archaeon]